MAETLDLRALINPSPRQDEFFAATQDREYTLYGGAAGGGKSYILRWWLVARLLHHFQQGRRNVRVGMFCDTYNALQDRQLSKIRFEFPSWLGSYSERLYEFKLHEQFGGGVIAFRNLDDPAKYASAEWADQAVDELTLLDKPIFTAINRRRRWAGVPDTDCKFAAATNPGGRGHAWVKKLWIDRDFTGEDDQYFDPKQFAFIQAKLTDNPHLDANYHRKFVTDEDRRIYVDGDWDVFSGQFFTSWRKHLHVIDGLRAFSDTDGLPPPHWKRWVGVDYGTAAPFCALWIAQDPSSGRRYVYRELYLAKLTAREQAQRILAVQRDDPVSFYVADPSMWSKIGVSATQYEQPRSAADDYRDEGIILRRAVNDRILGWNQVRQALALREDGQPGLLVLENCRHLIRTLPQMIHDDRNPEDMETEHVEDHACDALRYSLNLSVVMRQEKVRRSRSRWAS